MFLSLADFSLSDDFDELDIDRFGMTAGSDGVIRHQKESGMATTTLQVSGTLMIADLTVILGIAVDSPVVVGLHLGNATGVSATPNFLTSCKLKSKNFKQNVKDNAKVDISFHVLNTLSGTYPS